MIKLANHPVLQMHIIQKIFQVYEEEKIMYCNFKSTQYLRDSFKGFADFDILVDHRAKTQSDGILTRFNCKKFDPIWIGKYPGVENWLAFDYETGEIYHVHLHYQIVTGKEYVNDYVMPWADLVLQSAIKDPEFKIYIANPNMEVLLLIIRILLKRKIINKQVKFNYFKARLTEGELKFFSEKMFSLDAAFNVQNFILNNGNIKSKDFKKLSGIIHRELKYSRRMKGFKALLLSLLFKYGLFQNKILRKVGTYNITKKVTSSGGKVIAFIGVDGSGKSTISKEINRWLSNAKVECKRVYLGSGDGPINLFASTVYALRLKIKKKTSSQKVIGSAKNESNISFFNNPIAVIKKYVQALAAYSLAIEKRKKIEKIHCYRLNGGFSVLDRYPQLQQSGINDGLKISGYNRNLNSKFIKSLEIREERLMQIVKTIHPDIVFRLNISAQVSMARKQEQSDFSYYSYKAEAIRQIQFNNSKLFEIDAEQKLEDVILSVKRIVWSSI